LYQFLQEWYRVLKKNGVIRLAVPDWKALIDIYSNTGELKFILGPLFGRIQVRRINLYIIKISIIIEIYLNY
jgi:ubiquinone/menaquinone biosynthesis C-methylase UbiE